MRAHTCATVGVCCLHVTGHLFCHQPIVPGSPRRDRPAWPEAMAIGRATIGVRNSDRKGVCFYYCRCAPDEMDGGGASVRLGACVLTMSARMCAERFSQSNHMKSRGRYYCQGYLLLFFRYYLFCLQDTSLVHLDWRRELRTCSSTREDVGAYPRARRGQRWRRWGPLPYFPPLSPRRSSALRGRRVDRRCCCWKERHCRCRPRPRRRQCQRHICHAVCANSSCPAAPRDPRRYQRIRSGRDSPEDLWPPHHLWGWAARFSSTAPP